jgi:hypothetical protein
MKLTLKKAKTTFMYKGIECVFSETADKILPSDAQKELLFKSFFSYVPINSIKWVDSKILRETEINSEELLPMYRIGNNEHELLLWPILNGSDLFLGVECSTERPELANLKPERKVK